MAGVYFIAAGASTRNRSKSLDRALDIDGVTKHLDQDARERLKQVFKDKEPIYAWGANRRGDLDKLSSGDYVVDVKNKTVVQVFRYGFMIEARNTGLQESIGWDDEKPQGEQRPYPLVFFLHSPKKTIQTDKGFFQSAFELERNQHWLVGQRWFSDDQVRSAMERTEKKSVEEFLGLAPSGAPATLSSITDTLSRPAKPKEMERLRPGWLLPVIEQVEHLRADQTHLEREHEDTVTHLFEKLGYSRGHEIKFQRGRVDITIVEAGSSSVGIVIEVKRDWSLSKKNIRYVKQAHNYALELGAPWVILTNGNRYIVYDRRRGLSVEDQFHSEFELTNLSPQGLQSLSCLAKASLK